MRKTHGLGSIGTYWFHLIPFIHIWIGWKVTCPTWSLLAEKFLLMINGRQLRKQTAERSYLEIYLAQGGLCRGNPHICMDACTLWLVAKRWSIRCFHVDLLVTLSFNSLIRWGDTYLYFLLAFSEIIVMHHFIMSSLGILVCFMMPIFIGVIHWNQTYVIAAKKMWASVLVCIRNIKNFMLGGEVQKISNFALGVFNFQCGVMISISWISVSMMINFYGGSNVWEDVVETLGP